MKYLIVFEYGTTKTIKQYKKYKCIDGWTFNKHNCWQFSKQGALKIIERLKEEYQNNSTAKFYLEEVEK